MLKQFRYPSNRQALLVAAASAVLLTTLVVLWLAVSTRTAVLNRQLDELDSQQLQIDQDMHRAWTELGEVTSAREMNRRMREVGFAPAEQIEFMVSATTTTTTSTTSEIISPTLPAGQGEGDR
jgi:hypothetical protein